jgi:hypothetical protein
MPLVPTSSEILTRFIYFSKFIRSSNNTVRYAAFLPSPKDNQTSVFRVSGLSEGQIWNIADCDVTPTQTNTIKGRADINSDDLVNSKLEVIPKEPPYRHANISGWPDDKTERKLMAIELARKAILYLVP